MSSLFTHYSMRELVPIVNKNDKVLRFLTPQEIHKKGLRHREVVIYIVDAHGRIYVQKRNGGIFDHSVAGHVRKGERYITAALREVREEVGLRLQPKDLEKIKKVYHRTWSPVKKYYNDRFFTLYVVKWSVDPREIRINHELEGIVPLSVKKIQDIFKKKNKKYKGGFLISFPIFLKFFRNKNN